MAAFSSSPSLIICSSSLATIFVMTRRRRKLLALGPRSSRFDIFRGRIIHLMFSKGGVGRALATQCVTIT